MRTDSSRVTKQRPTNSPDALIELEMYAVGLSRPTTNKTTCRIENSLWDRALAGP
jgi:hypothetical protein